MATSMRSVPSWRALSFLPRVTACLDSAYLAREMCDMISAMGMVPRIKPNSAQRQGKPAVARDGRLVHRRQGDVRLRVPPAQHHRVGLCRTQEDIRGLHPVPQAGQPGKGDLDPRHDIKLVARSQAKDGMLTQDRIATLAA